MRHLAFALLLGGCANYTVCATREARELDPDIQATLEDAVAYWEGEGYSGITVIDGETCDAPTVVSHDLPRNVWADSRHTESNLVDDYCHPRRIRLNGERWARVKARGKAWHVVAHEIGHLYCLEHTPAGVMGVINL